MKNITYILSALTLMGSLAFADKINTQDPNSNLGKTLPGVTEGGSSDMGNCPVCKADVSQKPLIAGEAYPNQLPSGAANDTSSKDGATK